MDIVESAYTTLRTIGKDERWLHKWIKEKPSRLGLGELTIERSELSHYKYRGGRLDILAYRADLDTYYEIEIMVGECDADHGFRTLDHWPESACATPTPATWRCWLQKTSPDATRQTSRPSHRSYTARSRSTTASDGKGTSRE
jgi:hypothetical protein